MQECQPITAEVTQKCAVKEAKNNSSLWTDNAMNTTALKQLLDTGTGAQHYVMEEQKGMNNLEHVCTHIVNCSAFTAP